ncbi:putative transmembrane protein [Candidatus Terasakiella magnetica]|uniref:Putative transmembrane protein n=1 Tax=Candidatus Terasakiella magnetica TaxID=1867952 RepID=A0A1C3RF21_9PROT|nr:DUF924 family protein [Candidatus Terasakiella magnetica]SCA55832.1 putative transmembrane protein [Candidatus Terasakiella magnetica]
MSKDINRILTFWFNSINPAEMATHREEWWVKNADFDKQITDEFSEVYEKAAKGELQNWQNTPLGAVALVIALDQFPRNMFRDSKKAFATDAQARKITRHAVEMGFDQHLPLGPRLFLYLPMEHSESAVDQNASVTLINTLGDEGYSEYAVKHQMVIEKFSRFPHRNDVLGRASTEEEIAFLNQPGSRF